MNDKSIFKKAVCINCMKWKADETGEKELYCACGGRMYLSAKWHVRLTVNGKTRVKAVSSRRKEAVDYLHSAKDAARRGALLPGEEKELTWKEAIKAFEKWLEGDNLADKTKSWYQGHIKHLNRFFDDAISLNNITVKMVEEYRDQRTAAPKSVAEEIKTIKRIYSLHCRWHSARVAPTLHAVAADLSKVEMPKYNNKRTRFLTEEEVQLLLNKCTIPHLKLAIQIALSTGLRYGNIMALEWKQIDVAARSITFQADKMKSKRLHVSPIMEHLAIALQDWRKGQKRLSPFVFPSPSVRNAHMVDMQTSWDNLLIDCNAELKKKKKPLMDDVVFHTLRHTFASHFLMNGGDLATLSELLDHASIQITKDRYGHLSSEHKRKAIDQFSSVFFASAVNR